MPKDRELNQLAQKLLGTWSISGEARGQVRFKWLHPGLFLQQNFDLTVFGRHIQGMEIIGRWREHNQQPAQELCSHAYIFTTGETLTYVYQLQRRRLTIWFGAVGAANHFQGTFSVDGQSYVGAWEWPNGGYQITATRLS